MIYNILKQDCYPRMRPMESLKKLLDSNSLDQAEQFLHNSSTIDPVIRDYNLAYISYKKNDLVESLYLLEKSKFSGLLSEEVDQAIISVKKDLGIYSVEKESFNIVDDIYLNTATINFDLFLSLVGILLFSFIFFSFKQKLKTSLFMLASTIVLGVFTYNINTLKTYINEAETIVYEGPSGIFDEKQIIPIGTKVILTKKFKQWSYIKYPEIYSGWVKNYKAKKL